MGESGEAVMQPGGPAVGPAGSTPHATPVALPVTAHPTSGPASPVIADVADVAETPAMRRSWIERELPVAIEERQFVLHFQPVVFVETGSVRSFEALIRWMHPIRGLVPPNDFIPVAEEIGLTLPITLWVLDATMEQIAAWEVAGHRGLQVAVNLSAAEVGSELFEAGLRKALDRWKVPPWQLVLELTERTFIDATQASVDRLQRLRQMGIEIAIDDFGTGYASLATVARLPVDIVKIDMSFTKGALHRHSDAAVCGAIRELARSLQLRCVAEGMETPGQVALFAELGCDELQGYHFSRPLTAEAATLLLDTAPRYAMPARRLADLSQRHLLLLDDEPNVLAALRRLLRRDGYVIHCATLPGEAFETLARHPVGVIVSDQRMAAMKGNDFLNRVKSLYPSTVRIMLSGFTELAAVTEAVNEGAIYKFLTKPWNDQMLAKHVRHAFELFEMVAHNERLKVDLHRTNQRLNALVGLQGRRIEVEQSSLAVVREALMVLPVPVIGIDPTGLIVISNLAADRWFCGSGSLLGTSVQDLLSAADLTQLEATGTCTLLLGGRVFDVQRNLIGQRSGGEGTIVSFVARTA
ncbi:MAG: complex sensory protein [Rhizobacter sp.]|nr:complex sensory protein [Rhizobacter sp.]